jgi:multidrug resistance efflux pump
MATEIASPPRLRTDLIVSRQETPAGPCFVLKEPRTRRFFRLREAEYSIARRLDGQTSLASVAATVASELETEVSAATLVPFVEQLRRGGLLEGPGAPPGRPRQPLFQGDLLWVRFKAFDPDRLLDRLAARLGFFFTPAFVVGAASLILWALVTVLVQRNEIAGDLSRLWSFQNLFLAWIAILTVTTLHEFAHGLTCKHFGGHVHEMGFLLIYLQPAFYCNISDAWLFPERSKRLWVTFAGAFFEMTLWGLATLAWRLVEPGTWVSDAALVVMATSAIKQVFNLNPLIKLDGYYLLSDWLDVPNLRQRSFQYVGARFKRLLGGDTSTVLELTPRERRICLGYGLVAVTFSYWLLSTMLIGFGRYFTYRWHGWGAVAWAGLFVGVMGNVAGKSPLRWPAWLSPKNNRLRLPGTFAAGLLVLYFLPVELKVGGEVEVAPARNTDVRAQVEGIIDDVFVKERDRVAAGDTLARLADHDYRSRLEMADAELAEKRANLRLLEAGARPEERDVARSAVGRAEERLRFAQAELERTRRLVAIEASPKSDLERAEAEVAVSRKDLEGEQARLALLVAGARPEEIAAMREDITHAEAQQRQLAEQLARVWVTAPHGGIVTTPKPRERIGENVKVGDLIMEVYAMDSVTAEIAIPEQDIGDIHEGQRGSVRLRAYPDRVFDGRVTAIGAAALEPEKQRGRVVKATIVLPNPDGVIKSSMTGYARIACGKRRALDVLTRGIQRYMRLEFWSWW